jgi:hypothetical protein
MNCQVLPLQTFTTCHELLHGPTQFAAGVLHGTPSDATLVQLGIDVVPPAPEGVPPPPLVVPPVDAAP